MVADDELFRMLREDKRAMVAGVDVTPDENGVHVVTVHSARVGRLIGRNGAGVDALLARIEALPRFAAVDVDLQFVEVTRPERDPVLLADHVIGRIERGAGADDAMKLSVKMARDAGAKACRVVLGESACGDAVEGPADAVVDAGGLVCSVWLR